MKDILVGVQRLSVVHTCLSVLGVIVLCALSLLPDEFVSNPSPKILVLLLAFLPGVWRLARSIVSRSSLRKDAIGIMPGLALALWILSTHIFGLLLQDFYLGIAAGTSFLGLLGYLSSGKSGASRARPFAYSKMLWWSAVVGTLILLPTVVLKDNWDKLGIITGHFSITEQIVNGIYPPRHITFANVLLPYHYGIDTLFAMVRVVFRLRFDVAIDLVTTVLFFYTILLYGHIGTRLFGKKVGPIAGFLGAFTSGFPSTSFLGFFNDMPPDIASNWFQHPWTLGIPLCLTLFLMLTNLDAEKKANPWSLLAIMVVTTVLGMAQTALYGIFVASVLGWAAITWLIAMARDSSGKSTARPHYLIDIACAVSAGTFFSFIVSDTTSLILRAVSESLVPRDGVLHGSWSQMILWNLQCFSIPLLFGIMGMVRARRMHIPSLIIAFSAIFVFNRYEYLYSWDIVKFTQVAWIPLSIFAAGFIAHVLTHSRYALRIASILPAVFLVIASMGFLWQSGTEGFQAWKKGMNVGNHTALWMELPRKNIPRNFINALAWVRQNVQAGEITLLPSEERTFDAAILAGLPVLLPGWGDYSLGFSTEEIDLRTQMLENIMTNLHREYTNEGVRWIVSSPESDINSQINEWVSQGVIARVAEFDDTIVYEFTAERE
ncbi:hypothetical protein A2881_03470 [Candidatus Peribacteria bacterium RIFCSPHIGHO2_01_FULL_55_13]|nr:MAG: hypothetical protein A2881_03470 [Candidatus Peribacteria bacterium RIFCSPHIGHO2_01_FULL_55_13]OGJ66801.1 MAG: hypothetical protein A3F36_01785 [Candidatus Peribacteria bacterium RIFCSPHIGHO2_12_FULL_55_11]